MRYPVFQSCRSAAFLLLAASACSDAPDAGQIPGAVMDTITTGRGAELARNARRPCGYETTADYQGVDIPPEHTHATARITYNATGLDVLEEGVDDHNAFAFRYTTEYTAMGEPSYIKWEAVDFETFQSWMVYDSFGRMIRYAIDNNGDGEEDLIATYKYGDDDRRLSAHLTGISNYDRTYHYDDDGRLIQVDRDNGFDGTVDEVTTFEYDDRSRVTSKHIVDKNGRIVENGTTRYDNANHVIGSNLTHFFFNPPGKFIQAGDFRYKGGLAASQVLTITSFAGDTQNSTDVETTSWRYDCR